EPIVWTGRRPSYAALDPAPDPGSGCTVKLTLHDRRSLLVQGLTCPRGGCSARAAGAAATPQKWGKDGRGTSKIGGDNEISCSPGKRGVGSAAERAPRIARRINLIQLVRPRKLSCTKGFPAIDFTAASSRHGRARSSPT